MIFINFISEFIGKKVIDYKGEEIGKLEDFIIFGGNAYPFMDAVVVKINKKKITIPWEYIVDINSDIKLNTELKHIKEYQTKPNDIKLIDILDKQIIDANGKKIDRVNDIELSKVDGKYKVIGINIGFKGIARRLGIDTIINGLKINIPGEYIVWKDLDISESDEYNLKLKVKDSNLKKLHPSDIANITEKLNDKDVNDILKTMDEDIAASVLEEITSDRQICLLDIMDNKKTANILNKMSPDSATDLLGCLSNDKASKLLDLMDKEKAANIRKLINYPPDTAGGIMTTEFAVINDEYTANEILDHLRKIVKDIRFIYYVYFVSNGVLTGIASLKDIIFANPDQRASEFMVKDLITVDELENESNVAKKIARYNLLAIPVINDKNEIKGIVTVDDAINVILPSKWKNKIPQIV